MSAKRFDGDSERNEDESVPVAELKWRVAYVHGVGCAVEDEDLFLSASRVS